MSRYILEFKASPIIDKDDQRPNYEPPHVFNHLYWAVKDTQTGTYLDGYTFSRRGGSPALG